MESNPQFDGVPPADGAGMSLLAKGLLILLSVCGVVVLVYFGYKQFAKPARNEPAGQELANNALPATTKAGPLAVTCDQLISPQTLALAYMRKNGEPTYRTSGPMSNLSCKYKGRDRKDIPGTGTEADFGPLFLGESLVVNLSCMEKLSWEAMGSQFDDFSKTMTDPLKMVKEGVALGKITSNEIGRKSTALVGDTSNYLMGNLSFLASNKKCIVNVIMWTAAANGNRTELFWKVAREIDKNLE